MNHNNIGIISGIENPTNTKTPNFKSTSPQLDDAIKKVFENFAKRKILAQINKALSKLQTGDILTYNGKEYRIIEIILDKNQLKIESYHGRNRGPFIIDESTILDGKISARGEAGKDIFFLGRIGENIGLNIDFDDFTNKDPNSIQLLTKYKTEKILEKRINKKSTKNLLPLKPKPIKAIKVMKKHFKKEGEAGRIYF